MKPGTTSPSASVAGRGAGQSLVEAPNLLSRVTHPSVVIAIVLLILGFCALFYNWLWSQHQFSSTSGDWSHAYMVPFICVYLMWQHRDGLARARVQTFWPGLVPLLLGVVSYVYFIVGVPNHMGQGFALVLAVFGVVLLIAGPRVMDFVFLPVAYLLFAITISERIMIEVTFRLQQWAATGAYIVLNAVGVQTDLKGNVLEVLKSDGTVEALNVAEACSGMRMVIAFVALGAAMALVATRMWWKRVILLALSIPLALALNVVRVVVLGIAALYNSNLASGEAHTFIGTVLLVPGFLVYLGLVWTLNKAVPEGKDKDEGTDLSPASKSAVGGAMA
jgi:exosortase